MKRQETWWEGLAKARLRRVAGTNGPIFLALNLADRETGCSEYGPVRCDPDPRLIRSDFQPQTTKTVTTRLVVIRRCTSWSGQSRVSFAGWIVGSTWQDASISSQHERSQRSKNLVS